LSNLQPSDYIAIQRLMYALHTQLRGRSFDLLEDSVIPQLVRRHLADRESVPIQPKLAQYSTPVD
jgi:hypothetical protein